MFAGHHVIGSPIAFAGDDRNLWDRCLTKCVEEFRAMSNDSSFLHIDSRKKTRDIDEGYNGNTETITETNKSTGLDR